MSPDLEKIFHDGAPVTFFIMVTIGVFSSNSLLKPSFFAGTILHPYSIVKDKQYYRILTSNFVHNDLMHLLLNELTLYLFCASLEEFLRAKSGLGSLEFLAIYLSSALTGGIAATLRNRKDFYYSSAGASGSIIGCLISFMLINPNYIGVYLPVIGGIKNIYTALIYILIVIAYQKRYRKARINHELHFFGAIGGILMTLILFPGLFK